MTTKVTKRKAGNELNLKKNIKKSHSKDELRKDVKKKFTNKDSKKPSNKSYNKDDKQKKFQSSTDKNASNEKPNWSEIRKKKKVLKVERKKAKISEQGYEVAQKAKLLCTQLQKKSNKKETIASLCIELHSLLKGKHYTSFALSHDMSRVIQVLIKNSNEKIKQEVAEELLPLIVQMAQSKYAHHSVKSMLKSGTNLLRHQIIERFYGHIIALATHSVSAPILDYAYGEFASQQEKITMQQEFYGEMYKNTKDTNVKSLNDVYKDSPEMKVAILTAVRANIQKILDKNLHDGELFHAVLNDYLNECSNENRAELISILCPLIVPLSNSQPGADAACICVWQATNKDKKAILKVVKEHATSMAMHKAGFKILLAIFSAIDDTVMVKKAVIATLMKSLQDLVTSHTGRKVIHFLVKSFDPTDLHPSFIKSLRDGLEKSTSKKDADTREKELKEVVLPAVAANIVEDAKFWFKDAATALLTHAIVQSLESESRKNVLDAIAKVICDPEWQVKKGDKTINGIEDAGISLAIKKMSLADKEHADKYTLSEAILNGMSIETLQKWVISNRGCFTLVQAIESKSELTEKFKALLKPCHKLLNSQDSQGANLLKKIIK